MSNFVEILEGQIDEERKSRLKSPGIEGDSKKMIQKKKMVPLRADMEIQSDEPTEGSQPETHCGASCQNSTATSEQPTSGGALWGPPVQAPPPPSTEKTGGALWGSPASEPPNKQNPSEGKCLMDLIMEPPPKPLKPTLFTYFDKLMSNGEV